MKNYTYLILAALLAPAAAMAADGASDPTPPATPTPPTYTPASRDGIKAAKTERYNNTQDYRAQRREDNKNLNSSKHDYWNQRYDHYQDPTNVAAPTRDNIAESRTTRYNNTQDYRAQRREDNKNLNSSKHDYWHQRNQNRKARANGAVPATN